MNVVNQSVVEAPTDLVAVRKIVEQHGRLTVPVSGLSDDTDLYTAGLTSLATVGILLALEDQFEIELPESLLSRETFRSLDAMVQAVRTVKS